MAWVNQEEKGVDVALSIPHRGDVSFDWATMLASLHLPDHIISSKSTASIDLAREKSIENAMQHDPEWILMLDSDIIPPIDVFEKLSRHDLDCVSAVYMARKDDPHPAAWVLDHNNCLSPVIRMDDNKIANVDAVGMGCMLVNSRVFRDIERPWFRWTQGFDSHPWDMRNVEGPVGISEDFYFCHKIREAGYNIYLDTDVFCIHEDDCIITDKGRATHSEYRERANE